MLMSFGGFSLTHKHKLTTIINLLYIHFHFHFLILFRFHFHFDLQFLIYLAKSFLDSGA